MASILRIKRSELSGNPAVLGAGELAYSALPNNGSNGGDRLYIGTGTESAGNAVNHVVIGGKYFTDMIDAATATKTAGTLVKRNAQGAAYLDIVGNVLGNVTGDISGNFTGDITGNVTGNVTGDVTGNLTGNVNGNAATASAWLTPRNLSLTGDGTATLANVSGAASVSAAFTLANVNSNIGSFGSATAIPILTVNAKGLVTAVSTANIATTLSIAGSSGSTGSVSLLTDTLTIAAGAGVSTSFDDTTNTLTVGLTGAASLSALTLSGALAANSITVTSTLTAGNTTVNDISVNGNAIVTGNLTVNGTMTAVNSTTVTIADKNLELAKDANTAILSDGGGITVGATLGGFTAATLTYSAIDNRWNMNKDLNVGTVYGALVGNAGTATTWATARNLSLTGDASATLASVDGSANVSGALTLATVNSNVGSFGDSVTVPNFTVNAKGLITAAGSTAIPYAGTSTKGLASFDSTQFSITSGAVTIAQIDGGSF
jgi:hypothetical protein